ncbi:MFS general substrate transporter, partial [Aspergillus sclerotioniger CBS 115572]
MMDSRKSISMDRVEEAPLETENHQFYPVGPRLIMVTISLMLAVFCVALDNTILSVAIPKITDDFKALNDIGWYASSYLLTTCAFQLLYGKLYTLFNIKAVFLVALFIFELGSLICGVSPTSTTLIVGRAIAGLGSAGIFNGALVTIAHTVALEKRPLFFGMIGGMYGIASVAGPLMGGAFTDHVNWRWCFYINLPIGGVTAVGLIFLLRLPTRQNVRPQGFWNIVAGLDPIGTALFVPAIICILLALQWGGVDYAWSNGRIIALFVLFAILLISFVVVQLMMNEKATVPRRIASQRTIAFASLFALCIGGSFFIMIYYIPIWFQAIRAADAVRSGIDSLPMILANVVGIVLSGALTTSTGYFTHWFFLSSIIMSIGAGLLTLLTVDASQAKWAGFLFLYGIGVGFGFQQGGIAAQAVLPLSDVSIGTATIMFIQMLGGSLFVSVAQNIFTKHLVANLAALHIPGLDPATVASAGATSFRAVVSEEYLPQVLVAYNSALIKIFQLSMILSCLSILGAVGIEWKNVKGKQ